LNGKKTFRDAFKEMLDSVAEKHTFDETREYLKNKIKLDPGFKVFFEWCKANDVPVVIVSSGMVPIIRGTLCFSLLLPSEIDSKCFFMQLSWRILLEKRTQRRSIS
jgi:2-hydroxy-3-keto-5-methylthiopentenyl-1-phosphate phosphatase